MVTHVNMSCVVISQSNITEPIPATDQSFAALILVCMFFGISSNLISFFHFYKTANPRTDTPNKVFNRRLYLQICVLNIVVSLLAVPQVQALLTPERCSPHLLFVNGAFCWIWTGATRLATDSSMYTVAVLNVARCVLIYRPGTTLPQKAPFLLVFVEIGITALSRIFSPIIIYGSVDARYYSKSLHCYYTDPEYLGPITREVYKRVSISHIGVLGLKILTILVIVISSLIAMILLYRAAVNARHANVAARPHHEACVTVAMVTTLYIVCHFPFFVNFVVYNYLGWHGNESFFGNGSTYLSWYHSYIVISFTSTLFSSLSPLVFFWSVKSFRQHFTRRMSVHSREANAEIN